MSREQFKQGIQRVDTKSGEEKHYDLLQALSLSMIREITAKESPQLRQIKGALADERLQTHPFQIPTLQPPIKDNGDAEVFPIYTD